MIDFKTTIYAAKEIKAGAKIVFGDFKFLRHLNGIVVEYLKQIFDKTYLLKNDLYSDRTLHKHDIEREKYETSL